MMHATFSDASMRTPDWKKVPDTSSTLINPYTPVNWASESVAQRHGHESRAQTSETVLSHCAQDMLVQSCTNILTGPTESNNSSSDEWTGDDEFFLTRPRMSASKVVPATVVAKVTHFQTPVKATYPSHADTEGELSPLSPDVEVRRGSSRYRSSMWWEKTGAHKTGENQGSEKRTRCASYYDEDLFGPDKVPSNDEVLDC